MTLVVLFTFSNLSVSVKLDPNCKSAVDRLLEFMVLVFISVKFPTEGRRPVADIVLPVISIFEPAVKVGCTLVAVMATAEILVADTFTEDKSTNDSLKAMSWLTFKKGII